MGIANQTSLTILRVERLYFGDNLAWLRHRDEFRTESVDFVYLDPPFDYNPLSRETAGE